MKCFASSIHQDSGHERQRAMKELATMDFLQPYFNRQAFESQVSRSVGNPRRDDWNGKKTLTSPHPSYNHQVASSPARTATAPRVPPRNEQAWGMSRSPCFYVFELSCVFFLPLVNEVYKGSRRGGGGTKQEKRSRRRGMVPGGKQVLVEIGRLGFFFFFFWVKSKMDCAGGVLVVLLYLITFSHVMCGEGKEVVIT